MRRLSIRINGVVQGVGFRPYVYGLAQELGLKGWVKNDGQGVAIQAEGAAAPLAEFRRRLPEEIPPLAQIHTLQCQELPIAGFESFVIQESGREGHQTLIAPDAGICPDCLKELFDPKDRRFHYPFINCTNCGPRFTIIESLPYDRPRTTMKDFPLCRPCAGEYQNAAHRRFHAQPNACPDCGPHLAFYDKEGQNPCPGQEPLKAARDYLKAGKILAVKGIGGWHLACDALNNQAVTLLRRRKYRYDKPFALMVPDLAAAKNFCHVNQEEAALLSNTARPIVILKKHDGAARLGAEIAPGNGYLGMMLPYTPLHYLLIEGMEALVMTSGNISSEPLAYEDADALKRLSGIADGFLGHNRAIFRPCDDSVAQFIAGQPRLTRRSRGYAPAPLPWAGKSPPILACGAQQKNAFCLIQGNQAFMSQHIGDLENAPTLGRYTREIAYFEAMFDIEPALIAYDMHPEYLSTKYALAREGIKIPVQHHHGHLASVLAEHGRNEQAIGLIFDGSGYGSDGKIWGGEILSGGFSSFNREGHLFYCPLPGGEMAIKEPWRMALAYLHGTYGAEAEKYYPAEWNPQECALVWQGVEKGINAPLTSSLGRLFDAVAALAGLKSRVNYEGQAAVELEQILDEKAGGSYAFEWVPGEEGNIIYWQPVIRQIMADLAAGAKAGAIAKRFHEAVIQLCLEGAEHLRRKRGMNLVCLSGGVWQNAYLMERTTAALQKAGFEVLSNQAVPVNDGGIALGQGAVAAALFKAKGGSNYVPSHSGHCRSHRK